MSLKLKKWFNNRYAPGIIPGCLRRTALAHFSCVSYWPDQAILYGTRKAPQVELVK